MPQAGVLPGADHVLDAGVDAVPVQEHFYVQARHSAAEPVKARVS
jgi:hypothetical protein